MAHDARVLIAISDAPGGADEGRRGDARRPAPRRARSSSSRCSGLDEDAVAAVLARHDATGDAAAYRERTGGNPFFLDELLREEAVGDDRRLRRPACAR